MEPGNSSAHEDLVNGRYRMLRELGEGAMGVVYLVADTLDDDRLIALKMVRDGVLSHESYQLFRDEFSALAQLRHPNVVEVYDFGTISGLGVQFFTMEFVEGKNLLDACQGCDPSRVRGHAVQICHALEYIHSHGFVHFDLKPDNIMVDAGGVVKVMDFGLVEKGSFFQAQVLKGTAPYIAPEMIKGGTVDHRLDLYSLGAVLFHVLAGRTLFTGKTLAEILECHLNEPPNLTDGLPRPIPPDLRRILARLLAKSPLDRYASAADVLAELEQDVDQQTVLDSSDLLSVYKLGSRLVGREEQFKRLLDTFRCQVMAPAPNTASTALVMGASGMGKSRLIQELRHKVQLEGVGFVQGACIECGGHSYLPFAEILRTLVRQILADSASAGTVSSVPPPPVEVEQAHDTSHLAAPHRLSLVEFARTIESPSSPLDAGPAVTPHADELTRPARSSRPPAQDGSAEVREPDTETMHSSGERTHRLLEVHAAALSMLVPEETGLRALAKGADVAVRPAREKDWLIDSICRFLVDLSRIHPLLLYCSDLHWADDLTVELFANLGRAAFEAKRARDVSVESLPRLMLCGCVRDEEIAGRTLDKTMDELTAGGVADAIRLHPLDPAAVAEMLHSMLGHVEIPDNALRILIERTGAVPFSIEATVQDVLERRSSRIGVSRQIGADELVSSFAPATVVQALDRMLSKLSTNEGAVVRLLATFNRPATIAVLREAGAMQGEELEQVLRRLRRRHLLERGWTEGEYQWNVRHARLRDHVYGGIELQERSRLHAAAGTALDRVYPGVERYLEDISQHFERAGNIDKAIHYLQAAADQAKRVYDLKRAATLYARAYDALRTLPDTPARKLLGVDLAIAIAEVSYYTPSEQNNARLQQAREVVEATADSQRQARVYNWLGRTSYALGRNQEAIRCFQEFMRLSEGTADDLTRALPYQVLGRVYIFLGRFEQAHDYLSRSAALLRGRPGCEEDLSYVLGMLGGCYVYLFGAFAQAEQLSLESIAIAEQIGHRTRVSNGQVYLGIVYALQGEWSRARAILDQGVKTAHRDGNVIGAGTGSSFLGLTYLAEGDTKRAVELCRFGRDHIARAGGTWTFSMVGSHLSEALLADGQPERALEVASETLPVIDAGERWGESCLHIAMGRIHAHLGNVEAARHSFAEALRAAEEQQSPSFACKVHLANGAFLLQRSESPEGTALVERALASFEAFGMPWYAGRARSLLGGAVDIGPCP